MKKVVQLQMLAVILCIAIMSCTSCKKKNNDDDGGSDCAGVTVTLASMKKAASDAGYSIEEGHSWDTGNVVGGFTIVIKNCYIPVLQYKDKASTDAVAKREMDAGYNYPIQNCKYITFSGASGGVVDDETEKVVLENLINGRALK